MTIDPLSAYNSPRLLGILTGHIGNLPEPEQTRARTALENHLISTRFVPETGLDGTPIVVIEVSYFDDNGATLLARLDAGRYGFTYDGERLSYRGTEL